MVKCVFYVSIDAQGKNLNLVLSNDEIQVRIGEHMCNVTSISSTQLNCAMPDAALLSSDTTNPVVIVSLRLVLLLTVTVYSTVVVL